MTVTVKLSAPRDYGTGGSCCWQNGIAPATGVPQTLQSPLLTGSSILLHCAYISSAFLASDSDLFFCSSVISAMPAPPLSHLTL